MVQDMQSDAIESPLSVEKLVESDRTVVGVSGEVDAASADRLRNAIIEVIDGGQPQVAVDMRDVSFMDSSGLRVLIAGFKAAESAGGALTVRNPSDVVVRLLDITGQLSRFVPEI
jgi:anti-sigma B factor antagonist